MSRGSKPGERRGGRKPGTPNKRTTTLAERLSEVMGEGWCPVVAMAKIAEDPATDLATRVRCLQNIAPYVLPQLRAVQTSVHGGKTLEELVAVSQTIVVTGVPDGSGLVGGNDQRSDSGDQVSAAITHAREAGEDWIASERPEGRQPDPVMPAAPQSARPVRLFIPEPDTPAYEPLGRDPYSM